MMRNQDAPSLWESVERVAREIAALHAQGRNADALELAQRACERFERSPLAHVNLGYMRVISGDFSGALAAYERALALAPGLEEAKRGRSVARLKLGERVSGDSISVVPFAGPPSVVPVDVLVMLCAGNGNVVIDELFDAQVARVTKVMIELHGDAPLPPCDVIFNAVGDADIAMPALERAEALARGVVAPVLNAPSRVAQTGRAAQAQRVRALGARAPQIQRIDRAAVAKLALPVLVRAAGFHAGAHFERIERDDDRARALTAMPPDGADLFAIEWIDTREPAGTYAKYRAIAVDGVVYPAHLAVSREWKVHYFSAEMASSAQYRERERAYLDDPARVIGARAWTLLERIARETGLDYAGIDFALDERGQVVVFECNATMAVRYPPDDAMWAYRRPAVDAIRRAVRSMLERYSST